jgi:c-di-GMP-binding flagellar brake protein YcgR
MNDIAPFSIHNSKQIVNNLSLLFANKCLICVRFGPREDQSYLATLLSVNERANEVVWDCGPQEHLNRHLLGSKQVSFHTDYNGIKVSFTGDAPKAVSLEGTPAFKAAIPSAMCWKERRAYYRAKILLSSPGYSLLTPEGGTPATLKLFDISLSGFSTLVNEAPKGFFEQLTPENPLGKCQLMLPKSGQEVVTMDVCYSHIVNPEQFKKSHKASFKFVNLSRANEDAIQSYIQWMQREKLQGNISLGQIGRVSSMRSAA